jgi:hypothetical protein
LFGIGIRVAGRHHVPRRIVSLSGVYSSKSMYIAIFIWICNHIIDGDIDTFLYGESVESSMGLRANCCILDI